jgi:hypothetical protein
MANNAACLAQTDKHKATAESVAYWNKSDIFQQAMALAFFLIPIKEVAAQIAQEAIDLARLKSTEKEAHRRRWFTQGKYKEGGGPAKVLMHENQLVQYLVYQQAQKYERYQEGNRSSEIEKEIKDSLNKHSYSFEQLTRLVEQTSLRKEDLIIHYLKTIAQFSNSNSEDLITAISCLVYNLQPKDASNLHSIFKAITPNYCSKRKLLLMNKLEKRFATFMQVCKPHGKQSYFQGQETVNTYWASLVEEFFLVATPWGTMCPEGNEKNFSDRVDSWVGKVVSNVRRRYVTQEDQQEVTRLHTVLCPECYVSLVADMGYGSAKEHLALPQFYLEGKQSSGDKTNMTKSNRKFNLKVEEQVEIARLATGYLDHESNRRARVMAKKLTVIVDGEIEGKLNTSATKTIWFKINDDKSLIKVATEDEEGSLIVAILPLRRQEMERSLRHRILGWEKYCIRLNYKQQINFKVRFSTTQEAEGEYLVGINCRPSFLPLIGNHIKQLLIAPPTLAMVPQYIGTMVTVFLTTVLMVWLFNGQQPSVITTEIDAIKYREGKTTDSDSSNPPIEPILKDNKPPKFDFGNHPLKASVNNDQLLIEIKIEDRDAAKQYYVDIRETKNSSTPLWGGRASKTAEEKMLKVALSAHIFNAGEYTLTLKEITEKKIVGRYNFTVKY